MDPEQRFDVLAHVVEITNASVEVHERLDSILGTINKHLGSRLAVLFLQETAKSQLTQANVWPRQPRGNAPLEVAFGQGEVGRAARDREPQLVRVSLPSGDPALDALCQEDELAALFPVMDDNRLYAVLLLIFARAAPWTSTRCVCCRWCPGRWPAPSATTAFISRPSAASPS